ncbi:MAG TPA: type II toxin-antitoxin system VapC family toxin [Gemmatimonadaceae bacterium]|nr:type II toxin-antitoxin system VapC family toxin [Gemmatimonadaceae bacterium]
MRYLLDTNVISEPFKRSPDRTVVRWLAEQSPLDLSISVLTIGELTMGFELVPDGKRRDELQRWVTQELPRRFVGRLLNVDDAVAREWGRLSAAGRVNGRELPATDGLLLATASVHSLIFVTRNERDCANRGIATLNPWT